MADVTDTLAGHHIVAYKHYREQGHESISAAKRALSLDLDKPASLMENDRIQALIELIGFHDVSDLGVKTTVNDLDQVIADIRHDPVHHPTHYTAYKGIEIIQLTEQMNFNRGNAVKYIARAGLKPDGDEIQDLEKAVWYINREIERMKSIGA